MLATVLGRPRQLLERLAEFSLLFLAIIQSIIDLHSDFILRSRLVSALINTLLNYFILSKLVLKLFELHELYYELQRCLVHQIFKTNNMNNETGIDIVSL